MAAAVKYRLYFLFALAIVLNFCFWANARLLKLEWLNVPPAPTFLQAVGSSLGDAQLAYRYNASLLQNFGSTGGRNQTLDSYNFDTLAEWFFLQDKLDSRANISPYLAAYYYGGAQTGENVRPLIPYLKQASYSPYPGKWRWLAHAVYLARHRVGDLDLAVALAQDLANHPDENKPIWTRQMVAFVHYAQGSNQAAYDILKSIMIAEVDTLPPQEIFVMKEYICQKLLTEEEAKADPLCQN